jgi:hypothetical protein
VLSDDDGCLVVLTDAGPLRATYGARMLGALARDRGCAPEPGEWVQLRHWCDGPVTVERCLARREQPLAPVIPLRPPGPGVPD